MQILFLSGHLPSPQSRQGGQKTSYHICEFLSRRHDVHLLCFGTEGERAVFDGQGMEIFRSWDVVPVSRWTRLRGVLSSPRLPVSVGARTSRTFRSKLRRLTQSHRFDVVILDHTAMWQYANHLGGGTLCVGLLHDVLTQLWKRKAEGAPNALSATILSVEAKRVEWWEQKALSKLDLVIAQCEKDRALLGELHPGLKRFVIQQWVSVPARRSSSETATNRDVDSVVFWGALDRSVNTDAVAYAVREIFPSVREAVPSAKFYVAGNNSESVASLTDGAPQVIRTGFVPDISTFLSNMQVALLPLRQGAGIKVKTLECMAAGVAVVTTPVGAEGIAAAHGVHLLIGETAEELASHTVRLLRRPEEARQMGERARNWFATEFDFSRPMAGLESLLVATTQRIAKHESSGSCTTGVCQDQPNGQYATQAQEKS
jgi:glycosyltransferase involved in cell wall biosynthesis